jgi:hypothetical protein
MAALARTPVLPEATLVGALSAHLSRPGTRSATTANVDSSRPVSADTVEKLEFWPRSQFRRLLAASMEICLGARLSDLLCYVRLSRTPCCGNDWRRQHYGRGCRIFAIPQFPSFSTISANSGRSATAWRTAQIDPNRANGIVQKSRISYCRDDVGLDLARHWSRPELLGDGGCRGLRRFRQAIGIVSLDLIPHRCPLAVSNRY